MNLTLSVDRKVVDRARHTAQSMGKSLNQLVREYLEELAGAASADDEIEEIERLSENSTGRSGGWKFDRNEIHERS